MYSGFYGTDSREGDLQEDYQSPFDFDTGVNRNYLFLSPGDSVTPPGSPAPRLPGSPRTASLPASEEDAAKENNPETLTEEEQEELKRELEKLAKTVDEYENEVAPDEFRKYFLFREKHTALGVLVLCLTLHMQIDLVEEEIQTLSQVLAAKEKHLAEIKRKLGVTVLTELKQNISKGFQDVASTTVYKKTSETLSEVGQKASAAFSTVGSVITKKLEDVKNSPTFKSFEEKVETLKTKVGGTKPAGGDFGDVLNSAANASATDPLTEHNPETQ